MIKIAKATALLLCLVCLGNGAACSLNVSVPPIPLPDSTRQEPLGKPFQLKFGESARLAGEIQVTFTQRVQDSRCPSDVQCIRAGDVTVRIRFAKDGASQSDLDLTLGADAPGRDSAQAEGYTVRLTEVLPSSKTSTQTLLPSDYTVTLIVSK